jgi:hypothetical protein
MFKRMLLAAGIAASIAFAGCTTAQQANVQSALAKLQTQVNDGCMVVQPVLISVAALDPTFAAAAAANGLFCQAALTLNAATVQTAISTGIPAINSALAASTLIPVDKKPLIAGALGAFQLLLTNALQVYGQAAPVTASTTPAAQ